ncbi:MAG: ribonuclease HI family protein [Armatimonadota bacterium]|nr:ribonuclease HI family protein [Armatimonadota bacterium]MDR5696668.1 ribonuclease HI family protein [Armatimonadota bacterium]
MKVIVRPDGASRGNPGPAAIGVVIEDGQGAVLREISEAIGPATNNVAEYRALLRGLEEAAALGATEVEIRTDSQLVANQLRGTYRVRSPVLAGLHEAARRILARFRHTEVRPVPREENARADRLANRALDRASGAADLLIERIVQEVRASGAEAVRGKIGRLDAPALRRLALRLAEELARRGA